MLKALVLRKRITDLRTQLDELTAKEAEFEKREAELTQDFESINEESTQEEKDAVSAAIDDFDSEKEEHDKQKKSLESEINEAEKELKELEEKQADQPEPEAAKEKEKADDEERTAWKGEEIRMFKTRGIRNMPAEERARFAQSDAVHTFAESVRSLASISEKRAVTGGDLTIGTEILPLIESEIYESSQLIPHVHVVNVSGTARQNIVGAIPEGVWTEMCATLNELAISFTDVEVDGYKIGGYVPVCNALLKDSDINLADEVIHLIGEGIAYGIDKAIVYGTGTKMPTGFAATATKVSASGKTDLALYKALVEATGNLKHARGDLFWVMNQATKASLIASSMSINSAGAIVAGTQNTMPVIGGSLIVCDFVPANELLGGYGQDYLLAEREGMSLAMSEHARFIEDETVFKGIARYDGKPVFADGFVAIGLTGDPTAAIDADHPFAGTTTDASTTTTGN